MFRPMKRGVDFLAVLVLVPSVLLTWLWQAVAAVRYLWKSTVLFTLSAFA